MERTEPRTLRQHLFNMFEGMLLGHFPHQKEHVLLIRQMEVMPRKELETVVMNMTVEMIREDGTKIISKVTGAAVTPREYLNVLQEWRERTDTAEEKTMAAFTGSVSSETKEEKEESSNFREFLSNVIDRGMSRLTDGE